MAIKDWSIISLLKYVKSKSVLFFDNIRILKIEIYSVLWSFSELHNINFHENVKKRAWKILSEFDKAFSSVIVKNFIDELKLKDEKKEFLIVWSYKITLINALQSLKMSFKVNIRMIILQQS